MIRTALLWLSAVIIGGTLGTWLPPPGPTKAAAKIEVPASRKVQAATAPKRNNRPAKRNDRQPIRKKTVAPPPGPLAWLADALR